VSAADLNRWLNGRKTTRAKRHRPAAGAPGAQGDTGRGRSVARTSLEPAAPRAGAADVRARVPAEVT
jgi:hypothetical protein